MYIRKYRYQNIYIYNIYIYIYIYKYNIYIYIYIYIYQNIYIKSSLAHCTNEARCVCIEAWRITDKINTTRRSDVNYSLTPRRSLASIIDRLCSLTWIALGRVVDTGEHALLYVSILSVLCLLYYAHVLLISTVNYIS